MSLYDIDLKGQFMGTQFLLLSDMLQGLSLMLHTIFTMCLSPYTYTMREAVDCLKSINLGSSGHLCTHSDSLAASLAGNANGLVSADMGEISVYFFILAVRSVGKLFAIESSKHRFNVHRH